MAEPGGDTQADRPAKDTQTFTFHLPDGKSGSITAPRGTTTEQAWGYLVQQHPEYGRSQTDVQSAPYDPSAREQGLLYGKPDPLGFVAGVGQGLLSQPEGLVQHVTGGAVDPNWIPGLQRRADQTPAGQAGQYVGAAIPYALSGRWMPKAIEEAGGAIGPIARYLFGAGQRSALPAAIQPTQGDPQNYWKDWGIQTGLGTLGGEVLHGLGRLLGLHPERLAREDQKAAAANTAEAARFRTESQAAEDARERNRLLAARNQTAAQRTQTIQQAVDRQNQRNTLDYAAAQAQHAAEEARRLDMPRQAVQSLLNDARGLIGLRPLEYNATRAAAPQVLREVGGELDRVYRQMSFDPNQGGWLANAQRVQRDIAQRLRQDPRAQALWQEVFQDRAFMPGLRAEAGAGAPATGVAPATVRGPGGQSFRVRSTPTGEVQGPLGTRSGPVSGDQLARMMSALTKGQQRFGLEAQRGGGAVYRDMAEGLARMRQSVERQLDARFPALAEQRRLANQAYFLTSRVMDAIDVHGAATPEQLLKAFKDAEGDTRFGTDQRYADIKDRLEQQHRQYTTPPEVPAAPTTIKGPAPLPQGKPETVPTVKPQAPAVTVDRSLPAGVGHLVAHAARLARVPHPAAVAAGEAVRRLGGRGVERGLRGLSTAARRGTGGVAAGVSRGVNDATTDEENQ